MKHILYVKLRIVDAFILTASMCCRALKRRLQYEMIDV